MVSTSYATGEVSGRVLGAETRCRTFVLGAGSVFVFMAVSLVRLYEQSERALPGAGRGHAFRQRVIKRRKTHFCMKPARMRLAADDARRARVVEAQSAMARQYSYDSRRADAEDLQELPRLRNRRRVPLKHRLDRQRRLNA